MATVVEDDNQKNVFVEEMANVFMQEDKSNWVPFLEHLLQVRVLFVDRFVVTRYDITCSFFFLELQSRAGPADSRTLTLENSDRTRGSLIKPTFSLNYHCSTQRCHSERNYF